MADDIETGQRPERVEGGIEMINIMRRPAHCQVDPQVEICGHHEHLFRQSSGTYSVSGVQHHIDMSFQVYRILASLKGFTSLFESVSIPQAGFAAIGCWYLEIVLAIYEHASTQNVFAWASVESILRAKHLFTEEDSSKTGLLLYLVFHLTGIMSCLYQAEEPANQDRFVPRRFSIQSACPMTRHEYWCYFGSYLEATNPHRPVCDTLTGFDYVFNPNQLNADVIERTLKMNIVWTDILGAHLDIDTSTNTLFLFRQAAVCLLNTSEPTGRQTFLRSCVIDGMMEECQLRGLMYEILLSLYVLYGQSPKSRQRFDEDEAFGGIPQPHRDSLLQRLCRGLWISNELQSRHKRVYILHTDFPMLGAKLQFLSEHTRLQEPRSLMQLWRDKRNTLQWWTFWAVVIFGVITVVLAAMQTVLAGLQVYYASSARYIAT
ncbi:hypothetical protein GGR53DRAFT_530804 [Hypoxylon sp. FL1150]|nr:hypothetical protein GGR53DRAFT_530804 [Hypoxylon sp. FL1150]